MIRITRIARLFPLPVALVLLVTLARPAVPAVRSIDLTGQPQAVALDPRSSRAFVLGDDATVWVVDLSQARVVRTFNGGGAIMGVSPSMALDARTARLFVVDPSNGFSPSVVRVLDSRGGAVRAVVHAGLGANALAVDERGGHLFVTNENEGTVSVFDACTARLSRTVSMGMTPSTLTVDSPAARVFVLQRLVQKRSIPSPNWVSVLDARSGARLGAVMVGNGSSDLAVDARSGRVFVTSGSDRIVYVLDARTGAILRTVTVGWLPTSAAIDERRGLVYVVNAGDGTLSLLDAQTGALLRTTRIDPTAGLIYPAPVALAVDEARDRVYLSAYGQVATVAGTLTLGGQGLLYVLDARTGAVLRRFTVGVAPQAVAVDARSGRVVVINEGGEIRAPAGWWAPWARLAGGWLPWLGRFTAPASSRDVPPSVSVIDAPA